MNTREKGDSSTTCEPSRLSAVASSLAELALVLSWFYLCDRHHAFYTHPRKHDPGSFCLVMAVAALLPNAFDSGLGGEAVLLRKRQILGRHQTDEWKGFMQTWILLYHYFNCTETYKVVRLFVASFSWMTGYGNCYYYLTSNDFSARRLAKAIVRLNAFAALCCLALGNQYMLYYICPLTTLHTILVYAIMAACSIGQLEVFDRLSQAPGGDRRCRHRLGKPECISPRVGPPPMDAAIRRALVSIRKIRCTNGTFGAVWRSTFGCTACCLRLQSGRTSSSS